jgi:aryl-alcohol dehydrogenase-like predicted oxidoreductase
VTGYAAHLPWLRKNDTIIRVNEKQIIESVDGSLKRLQTDYVDLMQIHWPDRYVPLWGEEIYDVEEERLSVPIETQLRAFAKLIKAGKIRYIGLSNETPWGIAQFAHIAKQMGLPRPISVQNPYNLLCRSDLETHLIEACRPSNGNVAILACSPLAGGALTGKYLNKATAPRDARLVKFYGYMVRYISGTAKEATQQYMHSADSTAMPLSALALSWVYRRPFITSTIIGATSVQQLTDNILALNIPPIELFENTVNDLYRRFREPTKGEVIVSDPFDDRSRVFDIDEQPWKFSADVDDEHMGI